VPDKLLQRVRYPGIIGVKELQYTCSHGVTPGKIFLTTNPQNDPPAGYGTLAFDDGRFGIALHNCRVVSLEQRHGFGGKYFQVTLEDERWVWKNAPVRASFNQLQPDGKLSPFTIASPTEIAVYLLGLAGVTNYRLVLPKGLTSKIRARVKDYLRPGQILPPTRTNPPCRWDGIPAMTALSEFAARFGCRIIYQPIGGRVLVAPLGGAWTAPKANLIDSKIGIDVPATPRAVVLYGAETLHQVRAPLEPVAEEYDGTYNHINLVSYAPVGTVRTLIVDGVSTHPLLASHRAEFKLADPKAPQDEAKAVWFTITGTSLANLTTLIAADSRLRDHVASAVHVSATTIRMTSKLDRTFGVTFKLSGAGVPPTARCATKIVQMAGSVKPGWGLSPPPLFPNVRATDRLSRDEAIRLAARSVWKTFRFVNVAPSFLSKLQEARREPDPKKWPKLEPLSVPGYGPLQIRQQLVPTTEMAERLEPTDRQLNAVQAGSQSFTTLGGTVLPDFYNGRNLARPAVVRGQYANVVGSVQWLVNDGGGKKRINSPLNSRVYVPWSIDLDNQLIVFSDYVYRYLPAGNSLLYDEPDLIYEGGCYVVDATSNMPVRYTQTQAIAGGFATPVADVFDDVVVSWIGKYDANNRLTKAVQTDYGDGFKRAKDYLNGMLVPYQIKASGTYIYSGLAKSNPDGAVQQVTWKMSTEKPGVTTVVSLNSETSTVIPPWGPRQLQEVLPPTRLNKLLNAADNPSGVANQVKEIIKRGLPKAIGNFLS